MLLQFPSVLRFLKFYRVESVLIFSPPPLILTSGEALLESAGKRPVEAVNRALGEAFALVTIPLTCFTLFLHHLLRYCCS